ncbi:MAG: Calx-beta domain-containing protein, partial [Planctomycetota bacterium]
MRRTLALAAIVALVGSVSLGDTFYATRDSGINYDNAYDNQGARSTVRTAKWGVKESYILDFDTAAISSFIGGDPIGHYTFTLYVMPSGGWPASPVSVNVQTINSNTEWAEGDDPNRFNSFGWTEGTAAVTAEYAQTYWYDDGGIPTLDVANCVSWQQEDGTPVSNFRYMPTSFTNSASLSGSSADHGSYISVALDEDVINDLLNNAKNRGLRMYRNAGENLENYTREAAAGQRPYLEVVYVGPTVQFDKSRSYGDESKASASIAVSLNAVSDQTVTVDYAVTGGDATGGGVDYTLNSGQLQFDPGVTTQTIPVTIVEDGENETNETIQVTLSSPVNATVGARGVHTYVILDNDATGGWQEVMAEVHADYTGSGGTIARFGDSISYTQAFFTQLQWSHTNTTPDDDTALAWVRGYVTADCWTWQDDAKAYDHGCMSGKTSNWPMQVELDPILTNIEYWLNKHKPEIAVILWGTNDLHAGPDLAGYIANMTEVVRACKAYGTMPILTTIPPRRNYVTKSSQYAAAVRQIATDENVPLIDYNQEILTRRPADWDGTLISGDGVHPSNTAPTRDFSQTMLSLNGYTLRNWMTLHECHDVYEQVIGAGPTTWHVHTISDLETAVSNYDSGDEILIYPGTYVLEVNLYLNTPDVLFRGSTGDPDDVILTGPGMNVNADPREGLNINADDVTVRDLTVQEVYWNGIHIRGENDVDRTWISNVKTLNCGERHIKGSSDQNSTTKICDDTIIEFVVMEQTKEKQGTPDDNYIGGIDVMGMKNLTIRDCVGINIHGATGGGRGMMMVYQGIDGATVERCKAYGCDRGICFGNPSGTGHQYMAPWCVVGGIIRNCFVTRPGASTIALELCDTKDVKVYHNSIYSEDASYWRVVHLWGPNTQNLQSKYNIIRGQVAEVSGGTWTDVGSIIGSAPQPNWFVDWTLADLHLTANATAAIDQGLPVPEVTDDFDQEPRDANPDIGGDEYTGPGLPIVTITATDAAAAEELQDTGTFTVSRDDNTGNLVVNYSVSGTAAPADYEETLTGSVTIPDGQLSADITITPVDDSEVEGDETLILTLTADPAYTIGSPSSGTVTIADNDVPTVTLSA